MRSPIGTGVSLGARPDYGPGWCDLRCGTCGATWVGMEHEPCGWCERAIEHLRRGQTALVLHPPEVDRDDVRYEDAMREWGGRLRRAVAAGLVKRLRAEAAWKREVRRGVA